MTLMLMEWIIFFDELKLQAIVLRDPSSLFDFIDNPSLPCKLSLLEAAKGIFQLYKAHHQAAEFRQWLGVP